jgi:hypothetical protein
VAHRLLPVFKHLAVAVERIASTVAQLKLLRQVVVAPPLTPVTLIPEL